MSEQDLLTQPRPLSDADTPGRRTFSGRARLAGYGAGVVLTIGLAALGFWLVTSWRAHSAATPASDPAAEATTPAATPQPGTWQRPVVSDAGLADRSGIRIVYVAVTGEGGLVDLRYQVLDPNKTFDLHNEARPPALVDEATGVVLNNLLMGHSHSGGYSAGQIYYLIFDNPGNLVQRGGTVSVLLGNAEVDHVEVK